MAEREVNILDPEFIQSRNLTDAQRARIDEMQKEIDDIWSKHGTYKVDDDAWKTMPLFMENEEFTEADVATNESLQALQNIKYEEVSKEERAQNFKTEGNRMLVMALNPEQTNFKNFARSAARSYSQGIAEKPDDRQLVAQMYGNRSMAHFVLENYGHGLEDAQKAIMLDSQYTKAYYRGAKCAERIRKFETARSLIEYGLRTNPPPAESAIAEFKAVLQAVERGEEALKQKDKKVRIQARSSAADSSQLARRITSSGIKISTQSEVSSEQWAQLKAHKPYFDETGVLHVPVLILYDEYSQTDFAQDVATDSHLGDLIEEMLPPPWDDKGRYQMLDGLCVFYKIDDGVAMPKYYKVDPDWQLVEIMRTATYVMPSMVATFHVVPEGSDALRDIKFEKE